MHIPVGGSKWANSFIPMQLIVYDPYQQKTERIQKKKKKKKSFDHAHEGHGQNAASPPQETLMASPSSCGRHRYEVGRCAVISDRSTATSAEPPKHSSINMQDMKNACLANYFLKQMQTRGLVTRQLRPHIVSKTCAPPPQAMR